MGTKPIRYVLVTGGSCGLDASKTTSVPVVAATKTLVACTRTEMAPFISLCRTEPATVGSLGSETSMTVSRLARYAAT